MKLISLFENSTKNPYINIIKKECEEWYDIIRHNPNEFKHLLGVWNDSTLEYEEVYKEWPSEDMLIDAMYECEIGLTDYIIMAYEARNEIPSENVQKALCDVSGHNIIHIIYMLKGVGQKPSLDVQLITCRSNGFSLVYILNWCKEINEHPHPQVLREAFNQMLIPPTKYKNIDHVLETSFYYTLDSTIQKIFEVYYPEAIKKYPYRFKAVAQSLVDNLRSTLETHTYPMDVVNKMIEYVYRDDEDMITTLKHRASAIQRKLDQRNK